MKVEPRLRDLAFGVRLGLTGVVAALLVGLWASLAHLRHHHANRDARPGVSLDDLVGAYHGIDAPAPLATALERGHPEGLDAAARRALAQWLASDKKSENYDNPDLGEQAPAELIQRHCLSCHARASADSSGIGKRIPLDYWDDVEKLAFARHLDATPEEILVTSTHTHALSLAVVTLAVIFLVQATRFSVALKSSVALLGGAGLAIDLAGWWLARTSAPLVWLVVIGGFAWSLSTALGSALVLAELWLPRRSRDSA
jgi:hypothetical protein